ncbi:hypothetical protein J6K93_06040 [Leuconostoc mesenteroides]|uniref:hypothetical protein n=1 Tax=Leuconostoc mesenteroides TaxID=1245 RepID=UPI001CBBF4E9|nr:hypothetical protein [Leuconostoc mesenteroides]MBZ1510736.1 hypothetical protein [Leuconostoc mesenteroides]
MTVTNQELMEELAELKWQLTQDRHVWKRAENVAKHFDVSLGTVKSWKRRELITGYKHDRTVIYDINAIERDLFQIEN